MFNGCPLVDSLHPSNDQYQILELIDEIYHTLVNQHIHFNLPHGNVGYPNNKALELGFNNLQIINSGACPLNVVYAGIHLGRITWDRSRHLNIEKTTTINLGYGKRINSVARINLNTFLKGIADLTHNQIHALERVLFTFAI